MVHYSAVMMIFLYHLIQIQAHLAFQILGYTYNHPQYAYGTNEAQSFLAGSYDFQLSEIEVYQKEKK